MYALSMLLLSTAFVSAQTTFDCTAVTDIPTIECEALVAIYNATNGPNWVYIDGNSSGLSNSNPTGDEWLTTTTPCSWFGILCNSSNQVTYLNLSGNGNVKFGLIGAIPAEIGNLTNLTELFLTSNELTSVPSEIGNLVNLTWLFLPDNQLTDLPPEIGDLSNLNYLYLYSNQFTSIPAGIWDLTNLTDMSFYDNQLTSVPPEIENLVSLRSLSLTSNQLTGIPVEIGGLSNLTFLLFDNNQLTDLPTEVWNLPNLINLYLSNNQLTSLPSDIQNLSNFRSWTLHDNPDLSGPLPLGLIDAPMLKFYFDNTQLCEPTYTAFQAWLNGIPDLQRTEVLCEPSTPTTDTDGDGLFDLWEMNGYDADGNGTIDVDFPAMGADPLHKDIFVEIDYMGATDNHGSHQPMPEAIELIVTAFDNAPVNNPDNTTGIHLHVDYGPNSPRWVGNTWGAGAVWGELSGSDELPHESNLCRDDNRWLGLIDTRDTHFDSARQGVFYYNVWAHHLCPHEALVSGSAVTPGRDFIVTLGGWRDSLVGDVNDQAGAFMHELGHSLGLKHGGLDDDPYKPNYFSVMNYHFQTEGINLDAQNPIFDFSQYDNPTINERNLDEPAGLMSPHPSITRTRYRCLDANLNPYTQNAVLGGGIDWNCDGDTNDQNVVSDINRFSGSEPLLINSITTSNDWDNLRFDGLPIIESSDQESEIAYNMVIAIANSITTTTPAIMFPPPGQIISEIGKHINWFGLGLDQNEQFTDDQICWYSTRDGHLGCGHELTVTVLDNSPSIRSRFDSSVIALTPGEHDIALQITKDDGEQVELEQPIPVNVYGTSEQLIPVTVVDESNVVVHTSNIVVRETFTSTGYTVELIDSIVLIPITIVPAEDSLTVIVDSEYVNGESIVIFDTNSTNVEIELLDREGNIVESELTILLQSTILLEVKLSQSEALSETSLFLIYFLASMLAIGTWGFWHISHKTLVFPEIFRKHDL